MRYILGVDVSSVQGTIQWSRLASVGVRFAWVKCTQGNDGADPRYRPNVDGARAVGIYVGAYHFAYNLPARVRGDGRTPQEEARRFFFISGGVGRAFGELPPAIDAEWPNVGEWGKWGCSAQQISEWQRVFAEEVAQLWGRAPVLYTYPFWWRVLAASADVSWAATYPLWIANYKGIDQEFPPEEAKPYVPPPWDMWTFWQWSADKGRRLPGCLTDIDRNVFAGTIEDLRELASVYGAPTQPELVSRRPPRIEDFATVHPDVPLERPSDDDE
jgi:lysozyme